MKHLNNNERQALTAHLLEVAVCHFIGEEATNGKLSPSNSVFDYEIDGENKSLYIDWRNQEQMYKGIFSYSSEFMETAKDLYEMVIIANESNIYDTLRFFAQRADKDTRFTKSYLEDEKEPIWTIDFTFDNDQYFMRYE